MNLDISPFQVVWAARGDNCRLVVDIRPDQRGGVYVHAQGAARRGGVGLASLLRNEGGSVGTSLAQTIHERRDQFHALRLGESLDPLNPNVNDYYEQAQAYFYQLTGDMASAREMATESLASLREQQSSSLAYFDVFFLAAMLAFGAGVSRPADETLSR